MASSHDIKSSQQTYSGFLTMAKWGTVACLLVAAVVVFLITR
ncbi:MAG TPA: aa3-type cytochrome c oxidase subunit IV [Novosphingobium sp.]|nr:aa3-type cytochrome c oxidase subunit IV [Novosphingobium sp.]